jgi:hypothetical protein
MLLGFCLNLMTLPVGFADTPFKEGAKGGKAREQPRRKKPLRKELASPDRKDDSHSTSSQAYRGDPAVFVFKK